MIEIAVHLFQVYSKVFFLEPRYADKKKKKDKQIPRRIE